ncbi:MAG: ABC transporter substrate-binding protein [Flavobacterium sp.]
MKTKITLLFLISLLLSVSSCEKKGNSKPLSETTTTNSIRYASGLSIDKKEGYSVVTVRNAWPEAKRNFTYILKEKNGIVPDSLQKHPIIAVPLQSIVVTSTTIIPFLEMLGVEKKLKGFPHTDYISSEKTRRLIDAGQVKNMGQNEKLDTEQLIDMSPNLIVVFGIDNANPTIDNLQKSGLKVLIQADWMEQTPLGKAEWIKLYGALFGKEKEAEVLFNAIVKSYEETIELAATVSTKPSVLYGSMYQDQWFVPKGDSWVAQFLKDAKANYLWRTTKGSGSFSLPFEKVLEKAQKADYWIVSGSFKNIADLQNSNPHYGQFEALKNKKVYTFDTKKGATGGAIYYELAASRPDLVLKDYLKIFHPDLLPTYTFTFAEKLQ